MIKTAILGATGVVGLEIIKILANHPFFEISQLIASEKSKGRAIAEFIDYEYINNLGVAALKTVDDFNLADADLIFSALPSEQAKKIEPRLAKEKPVISTASSFRQDPFTPLIICGVNHHHAQLLKIQQQKYQFKGFIAPKPNCTTVGLAVTLFPIYQQFGLEKVILTSIQSLSGAGRSPGVKGLDIIDNILPFIPGEEAKIKQEPSKILGRIEGEMIIPAQFSISATCLRGPILDGHLLSVELKTKQKANVNEIIELFTNFKLPAEIAKLPSGSNNLIYYSQDQMRPQPRLDRLRGGGMTVTIGRVEPSNAFDGVKFIALIPNAVLGASGGAVLLAEYLTKFFENQSSV